jgi:hypothetical protein
MEGVDARERCGGSAGRRGAGRAVESDFRFTSIDDWFFIMNRAIRRSSQRMDGEKQRVPCD